MKIDDKLLLKENEAAQLLGMSAHFLRRDRISDRPVGIPFIRIGASVRYRRVDLEGWITEQINRQSISPKSRDIVPDTQTGELRRRGRPRKTLRRVSVGDSNT